MAIIVYDISERESFDTVIDWLNSVCFKLKDHHTRPESCLYYLVGNKRDLDAQYGLRDVEECEGKEWVETYHFM